MHLLDLTHPTAHTVAFGGRRPLVSRWASGPPQAQRRLAQLVVLAALVIAVCSATAAPGYAKIPDWTEEEDPAGVVYDRAKYNAAKSAGGTAADARRQAAIAGAKVTLQRSQGRRFTDIDLSRVRIGPNAGTQITGKDGFFRWYVPTGDYRVVVSKANYATASSRAVHVPPPATDLHVALAPLSPSEQASSARTVMPLGTAALLLAFGLVLGRRVTKRHREPRVSS